MRQWAYKGFAAYTYIGDKKPGDRNGSDTYQILFEDDPSIDVYQDNNKFGMKTVRGTDSAANFFVYIEP